MFWERLKQLRKKHGYTQTMLAEELKLSKGTVAMWEVGKRNPDINMLHRIARLFNVNMEYLMGFTDIEEPIDVLAQHVEQEESLSDVPGQPAKQNEMTLRINISIEGVKVYEN